MRRTPPALLLLALLAAAPTAAQRSAGVAGRVVDAESGEPVPRAAVVLPELGRRTLTDTDGRFSFEALPEGEHRWVVRQVGYTAWEETAAVADGGRYTIALLARPVELATVRVVADRLERRRRAHGSRVRVVEAGEVQMTGAPHLLDVVLSRAIPGGYRCGAGALCVHGDSVRVVIDERPLLSAQGTEGVLMALSPAEVYAVEAYGSGSLVRVYTRWFVENTRGPLRPLGPLAAF